MEIDIKTISTPDKGSLSFFESTRDVPFEIECVRFFHGAPEGNEYKGHEHHKLNQLLVCTYGAIEVLLDDGSAPSTYMLDDPTKGLLVENLDWCDVHWLFEDSVLMVASSDIDEDGIHIQDCAVLNDENRTDSKAIEGIRGINNLRNYRCKSKSVVIDGRRDIPFDIERIYYIHDVPVGVLRGGHAHRTLNQLLVCPNGAIEVLIDDGCKKGSVILDSPTKVLLVGSMVWHDMRWLAKGSVLAVLASAYYDEADYIRDREIFVCEVAAKSEG